MNWQEKLAMFGEIIDDFPTCPHCGYQPSDTTEWYESGDWECPRCGKEFHVDVEHSMTYTTTKGSEV